MATGRIELGVKDRKLLEGWSRAQRVEHRVKIRSQIILKAAEGCSGREISKSLSIPEVTVSKWRRRFLRHGLVGLEDAPRSGKPTKYDEVTVKRVLELLDRNPPAGYGRWNGRLVAQHLGDVSSDQVWRILRQQGIELERRHSWFPLTRSLRVRLPTLWVFISILPRMRSSLPSMKNQPFKPWNVRKVGSDCPMARR